MEPSGNPSHDQDLVTVFSLAAGGTSEMETFAVQALLESNGIPTVLIGDSPVPSLAEEIRVPRDHEVQAKQLIAEALSAGASGAAEAEAEGEKV